MIYGLSFGLDIGGNWFSVRSENGGKLKMGKLLDTRDLGNCSSIQLNKEKCFHHFAEAWGIYQGTWY